MNEGLDAAIFYSGVAALVGGVIRTVRAAVEHNARDTLGIALAGIGVLALTVAIAGFMMSPKSVLPF